jgi:hypothetical protein
MALTKITSTNIGANAVTSTALNLTTLSAGNTVITGTASVSTTLSAGNTTITGFANVTGAGSGTFTPYNDPLVVKGTDYTYLHLQGTNNQAAVIYNRNGTNGWFHGLDNNGSMKLVAMAAMDGTGLGNAKDGTAAMLVDTSGRITTPYQPAFSARRTSSTGTSTVILYDDIILNVGSNYSSSTGRFTAPVAGNYLFYMTFSLDRTTSTADAFVDIRKNTSTILRVYTTGNGDASSHPSQSGQVVLPMSAGDYVDCYFVSGPTSIHPNGNHNVFGGHLLG